MHNDKSSTFYDNIIEVTGKIFRSFEKKLENSPEKKNLKRRWKNS